MNDLRTGQVARAAGVNRQTLRYYERRGLLACPRRSPGGHRLYPAETVRTVRMIKAAQRLGFSLREIADLVQQGPQRRPGRPAPGLRDRTAAKLAEVEAAIAELTVIAGTLRAALDAGCTDLTDCTTRPGCPLSFDESLEGPARDGARARPPALAGCPPPRGR